MSSDLFNNHIFDDRQIIIKFINLSWKYENSSKYAIRNINLEIRKGDVILITGPSGSGKTTICRCINGLIPHFYRGEQDGDVYVNELNTKDYDIPVLSTTVGFLFDTPSNQLFCSTVEEEIAFGLENLCLPPIEIRKKVKEGLKFSRLIGNETKSPHSLSGGQQQSLALASILVMQPDILVLDEPTANLDPIGTKLVFDRIIELSRNKEKTLIIVEHKVDEILPIANRMIVMNEGNIILNGDPKNVIKELINRNDVQIQLPDVTELAFELIKRGYNIDKIPITLNEGVELIQNLIKNKEIVISVSDGGVYLKNKEPRMLKDNVAIKCENVEYVYPDGTKAISNLNLEIKEGDFVAFIGQNGSGKSTTAKLLNGLYKPTKGRILLFGEDISKKDTADISSIVGYVFQNPDDQFFAKTVREELEFGPKNLKLPSDEIKRRVETVAKELEIYDYLESSPFALSQGLRQRVAFASIMTLEPKILIVDEPTTGQDYLRAKTVMDICKSYNDKGKTVIVISHNMNLVAEYCNYAFVFKDGNILLKGPVREIFSQEEKLTQASLEPPMITKLFNILSKEFNLPNNIISVEEAISVLGVASVSKPQ